MTFGIGRRRGDLCDSSHELTDAHSCAELEFPRARAPYIARGEFSLATVVRLHAQTKYSKRFRTAYGLHRSRAVAQHRTSISEFPGSPHRSAPTGIATPYCRSSSPYSDAQFVADSVPHWTIRG